METETPMGSLTPQGRALSFVRQILLVEDNAGDILAITQILSAASSSLKLRVAMDGEQALQMLADPAFKADLIILDLNIPKVPGLDLLARCKPTEPVVVFSSSSHPTEVQRAMELGAREFVHKPFDLEEFTKVVMKMIQDWVKPGVDCAGA